MDVFVLLEVLEDCIWWCIGVVVVGLLGLFFGGWLFLGGVWFGV